MRGDLTGGGPQGSQQRVELSWSDGAWLGGGVDSILGGNIGFEDEFKEILLCALISNGANHIEKKILERDPTMLSSKCGPPFRPRSVPHVWFRVRIHYGS
jgi:hypothetical protein